jgi:hypothetical protein
MRMKSEGIQIQQRYLRLKAISSLVLNKIEISPRTSPRLDTENIGSLTKMVPDASSSSSSSSSSSVDFMNTSEITISTIKNITMTSVDGRNVFTGGETKARTESKDVLMSHHLTQMTNAFQKIESPRSDEGGLEDQCWKRSDAPLNSSSSNGHLNGNLKIINPSNAALKTTWRKFASCSEMERIVYPVADIDVAKLSMLGESNKKNIVTILASGTYQMRIISKNSKHSFDVFFSHPDITVLNDWFQLIKPHVVTNPEANTNLL